MKKTFEYVGLFVLAVFSFYFTDKVVKMVNKEDPLMEEISSYAKSVNSSCIEGYRSEDGVILGVSGFVVDEEASYSNMKGFGFNEELVVFEEDICNINERNMKDEYIVKGNESKNAVSILVLVNDGSLLESFVSIAKSKGVKVDFVMSGSTLETYKDYFSSLDNEQFGFHYSGNNQVDFNKFTSILNEIDKEDDFYCISSSVFDIKEMCSDEGILSVKTKYIYSKDTLLNIKNNLNKGNIFVLKENNNVLEEFGTVINHIKGKGVHIFSLEDMLD